MKIVIADGRSATIRGKTALEGDTAIVNKELGERLIAEGLANRIIEETEDRIVAPPEDRGVRRFCAHTRFTRGVGHS